MILFCYIHTGIVLWLTMYGLNAFILAILYLYHRSASTAAPDPGMDALPPVTVQVPIYNERHVIERVIDAVAALDYPPDRLQIHILDDSTDETTHIAQARAAFHRQRGVDISVLHRSRRDGAKAGALAWGLDYATGDYIAIFDADFRPDPDFLQQTVPYFLTRPRLGFIQTRWTYLNADYSSLTQAQVLALDGHFVVEQNGRHRSGLLMSFNGAGGVWRRTCIETSGGWQADTLCEDLDLSYRAQMAGWEALYLPHIATPTEVPPQITAFKQQQARWAQGSVQTLRKLASPILRHPGFNLAQKGMALLHLSSYLAHPLMVLLLIMTLPMMTAPTASPLLLSVLSLFSLSLPLVYALGQISLYPHWWRRMWSLPLLVLVGIGIAWSNTRAVWRGLTHWGGAFARTPKFRLEGRQGHWAKSNYRLRTRLDGGLIGEIALLLYALIAIGTGYGTGNRETIPLLICYAAAFGAVVGREMWETYIWEKLRRKKRDDFTPRTPTTTTQGHLD